jgi:hypothetical protein
MVDRLPFKETYSTVTVAGAGVGEKVGVGVGEKVGVGVGEKVGVGVGVEADIGIIFKRNNMYIITAIKAINANISAILPESIIIVIITTVQNLNFFLSISLYMSY